LIGDQNLFHPDRIIPPEKKEEKAVPKPDLILYGTLITDQLSMAFIEDRKAPKTTPGRGKRQTILHKGDQVSGYILREVEAGRIILAKGEERLIVLLEDGEKRKTVTETQISPATAGMISGSPQQAAAVVSSSTPPQYPLQKNAQVAPAPPAVATAPGQIGTDESVPWPTTRRGKLAEVQKRKAERQRAAP
jgi:hypothetical protein